MTAPDPALVEAESLLHQARIIMAAWSNGACCRYPDVCVTPCRAYGEWEGAVISLCSRIRGMDTSEGEPL